MWRRFVTIVRRAAQSRGAAAFLIAALVVGVVVGLGAAGLVWLVTLVSDITDGTERALSLGRWIALIAVPVGITASWAVNRVWGPGIESGGVTETIAGLSLRGGYLPTRTAPAKILATAATLGTGGSGGREGPIVQIGATIGSTFARHTRFGEDQIRSLVAAGAGAGIGASFNAPIAGMLFAMEVVLGNFAIRHLNAVVVTSVAAAVTTRSLVGEERILSAPPHTLSDPRELLLYVLVGLLAVAFGYAFLRVLDVTEGQRATDRFPVWVRPVVAGLTVAVIGVIEPRVLGTGQDFLGEMLRLSPDTQQVWWVLALLGLGKAMTSAATRAGGGSCGTFMPALFIGGVMGAGVALLLGPVWVFSDLEPGALAVVGMAATFAATAKAPLTSIIIVFEITGDYGLVLPLMLASSLATFLEDRFHPASVYMLPLRRAGIHLPRREDIDLLDTVSVGEVMSEDLTALTPTMSTLQVDEIFDRERHHGLPVVVDARLLGLVTVSDITKAGGPQADVSAAEVMNTRPITVTPTMPVSAALARMAALGIGRMPVVADEDPGRFVGMFRRSSVVDAYHHALGSTTDRHLYRERLRQRTLPGATFFEMPIRTGSPAHGRTVRTLEWPEDAILVSIRRGSAVLIPHGDTVLRAGDAITAFGSSQSRVDLAYVIEPVDPASPPDE